MGAIAQMGGNGVDEGEEQHEEKRCQRPHRGKSRGEDRVRPVAIATRTLRPGSSLGKGTRSQLPATRWPSSPRRGAGGRPAVVGEAEERGLHAECQQHQEQRRIGIDVGGHAIVARFAGHVARMNQHQQIVQETAYDAAQPVDYRVFHQRVQFCHLCFPSYDFGREITVFLAKDKAEVTFFVLLCGAGSLRLAENHETPPRPLRPF